jgi:hypothetical protein
MRFAMPICVPGLGLVKTLCPRAPRKVRRHGDIDVALSHEQLLDVFRVRQKLAMSAHDLKSLFPNGRSRGSRSSACLQVTTISLAELKD